MSKVAIVTGASSGIGRAAALALAARGVGSILTYNRNPDGAGRLVQEIEGLGARAAALPLDLGRSNGFAAFRAEVVAVLGRVWQVERFDCLVNNAGLAGMAMFEDTTEALFDDLVRVLLKGPYFLTQALLPVLADGGAIVNVSSSSALPGEASPGYSAYATMKGGVAVMTRYMAKELSARGIRVNAVAPGPTRTRLGGDAFDKFPEVIPPLVARTALGRLGEPEDVGAAIAALLSDECRWVTAQHIEVSGGFGL
jgi:NAD(P)-dependent dehydrogenase (short-subunit alcohol dehydrogenase family)